MGFLLFIIALVLTVICLPLGILAVIFDRHSRLDKYFYRLAIIIDIFGNAMMASLFNKILVKGDYFRFGKFPNTISYVLGVNKKLGTLTKTGSLISKFLNKIDKNHVENAVDNPNQILYRKGNKLTK